jgi:3-oxoadipate enol-lactonase
VIRMQDNGNGRRPLVVMLHSLGTDHRLWRHQAAALRASYDVAIPDALGHGQSCWDGPVCLDDWNAELRRVIGTRTAHIIGLSMGGIQAIAFAATFPTQVRSVTIANSFARLPVEVADARVEDCAATIRRFGMAAYARRYLEQTLTRRLDPATYDALFDAISNMRPDAYIASAVATFRSDVVPLLTQVACPALVMTGALDVKVPAERTAEIVAGLSDVVHTVVPAAGHLSCVENPVDFTGALTSFLTRVDASALVDQVGHQ